MTVELRFDSRTSGSYSTVTTVRIDQFATTASGGQANAGTIPRRLLVRPHSLSRHRRTADALCLPLYRLPTPNGLGVCAVDGRPKGALELLRGEPRRYAVTSSDGRQKNGRFCGECSTRLWGEPLKFPQVAVLQPGTLDDTSWLWPIGHIWTRSAQPWISIPKDTLNFEGQPEDPLVPINAWRDRSIGGRPAGG